MGESLANVIRSGESDKLELLRPNATSDVVGRAVCAFLNSGGGRVIVGVRDGQIGGVPNAERAKERIQQTVMAGLSPSVPLSVATESVGGKKILVIDVPEGVQIPYSYTGTIFARQGTRVIAARREDISELIRRRQAQEVRWERWPALGAELTDLDLDQIEETVRTAQRRFYSFAKRHPLAVLEELGLAGSGQIRNSALVLFGKNPGRWYPQIRVRAARFTSPDRRTFADNRIFEGNAFQLLRQLESFLGQHIAIASRLPDKGMTRTDAAAFPAEALREALINALIHRDYAAPDGTTSVAIFDDQVEFSNAGALPAGMVFDDLRGPHLSRPRNPDIAHVFFLRGLIEQWGIGTNEIVRTCDAAGIRSEWRAVGGGIRLTLSSQVKRTAPVADLNARQRAFIQATAAGARVDATTYRKRHARDVNERSARSDLAQLVESGFLRREGKGASTTYVRTEKRL